ncbi:MAG: hypothetical protein BGO98_30770 [Myxococcales bacterium 68-20]|nr:MAG: hypothetical protein BGO98_30770 [Myxococcales bacterium 68-20]
MIAERGTRLEYLRRDRSAEGEPSTILDCLPAGRVFPPGSEPRKGATTLPSYPEEDQRSAAKGARGLAPEDETTRASRSRSRLAADSC